MRVLSLREDDESATMSYICPPKAKLPSPNRWRNFAGYTPRRPADFAAGLIDSPLGLPFEWSTWFGWNQQPGTGSVLADPIIPFSVQDSMGNLIYEGGLQDRVAMSTVTGALIFEFFIRNTQPGLSGSVSAVGITGFDSFTTSFFRI